MRRRVAALSLALMTLLVAAPASAEDPADIEDGKVCVRSAILFGAGREYCVTWSES